jgi:type IX secretion system PorP/SprF family membrane protein
MLITYLLRSQDIHFSQFYNNKLALNPAYTGMYEGNLRASIHYKDQWRVIQQPFSTFSVGIDKSFLDPSKNVQIGGGLFAFRDKAGELSLSNTSLNLLVSAIVKINDISKLSGGLQVGFGQRTIDISSMRWGNQYTEDGFIGGNSNETIDFSNQNYLDVGGGLVYSLKGNRTGTSAKEFIEATIGIAFHHLNKPNYSFSGNKNDMLGTKLLLNGDFLIPIPNKNIALAPSFLFALQKQSREIVAGTLVKYILKEGSKYTGFGNESSLYFGVHYRFYDALIPSVMFETGYFGFGLSYDTNVSRLQTATQSKGGFELMIRYTIPPSASYGTGRI